ncbi:hypothetical protein [Streptomyces sp. NPDC059071]|uniref:hypothetical protein n=1 Tax=unclassified Streptomyces TaxID=2593676 RepID=UPI003665D9FD
MATVELIDPDGYTVETARDVPDAEVAATEVYFLGPIAVREAAKWADFGYRAHNYRTRVS